MQYSTFFASVLAAAATAHAQATASSFDSSAHGFDPESALTITLRAGERELRPIVLPEPRDSVSRRVRARRDPTITEVELSVGEGVDNQDIRCQILDKERQPIVVLRGNNTDITLADGGNGPWTLREPSVVDRVVCDQDFEKIDPEDERLQVSVLIQSQNPEVGINFDLSGVLEDTVEVAEDTPIETVTLTISGELVDPALRCQLVGADGPITVLRNGNVRQTFAGGDEWTLQEETVVEQIICDPDFQDEEE